MAHSGSPHISLVFQAVAGELNRYRHINARTIPGGFFSNGLTRNRSNGCAAGNSPLLTFPALRPSNKASWSWRNQLFDMWYLESVDEQDNVRTM